MWVTLARLNLHFERDAMRHVLLRSGTQKLCRHFLTITFLWLQVRPDPSNRLPTKYRERNFRLLFRLRELDNKFSQVRHVFQELFLYALLRLDLKSNYKCHGNYFHVKASFSPGFFIFFFFIIIIIIESSEVCHYAKFTKSLSYKIDIVGLCWFECRCFPSFTFICLQFKKRFLRFVCFACCLRGPGKLQVGALPI